ncbi:hypothetical protein TWF225_001650 [Orbilia oligospora]|nr:hypothetical protein TWF225_001650 [Orbilia oligospora]KAF3233098.1 hypothetical protein TWF128_003260 [Orbilia oligospora]KAF3275821.1 hypothetical protein TWF132_002592 [Orbilia oligospora]
MAFSQVIAQNFENQKYALESASFLGIAKIPLSKIRTKNECDLDAKNIARLQSIFRVEGCLRLETSHHVGVIVDEVSLRDDHRSSLKRESPVLLTDIPDVECIYGHHRLVAARILAPQNRWWTARVYRKGHPKLIYDELRDTFDNSQGFLDGEIFRKILLFQDNVTSAKKWWARLSKTKANDLKQLLKLHTTTEAFKQLLPYRGLWYSRFTASGRIQDIIDGERNGHLASASEQSTSPRKNGASLDLAWQEPIVSDYFGTQMEISPEPVDELSLIIDRFMLTEGLTLTYSPAIIPTELGSCAAAINYGLRDKSLVPNVGALQFALISDGYEFPNMIEGYPWSSDSTGGDGWDCSNVNTTQEEAIQMVAAPDTEYSSTSDRSLEVPELNIQDDFFRFVELGLCEGELTDHSLGTGDHLTLQKRLEEGEKGEAYYFRDSFFSVPSGSNPGSEWPSGD